MILELPFCTPDMSFKPVISLESSNLIYLRWEAEVFVGVGVLLLMSQAIDFDTMALFFFDLGVITGCSLISVKFLYFLRVLLTKEFSKIFEGDD